MTDVQNILNEAADLIEQRGWWSGSSHGSDAEGGLCAQLAIAEVTLYHEYGDETMGKYRDTMDELSRRIGGEYINSFYNVTTWNDSRESAEEVLKLMRGQQ